MAVVMIIDDEDDVLATIAKLIERSGHRVVAFSDPTLAMEEFKRNPTDVVVADYVYDDFPNLTGLDVIQQIRLAKPFVRTILISGRIDHGKLNEETLASEAKARAYCDYYVAKPDVLRLVEVVKEAISDLEAKSSDWREIAADYTASERLNPEHVRQLNDSIKDSFLMPGEEPEE